MVFSSTVFLFLFLPAVWILYLLIPSRFLLARNVLLGAASLLFYAYGEPIYIAIMLLSVLFNYCAARSIGTAREHHDEKRRHALTVFSVIINLRTRQTLDQLFYDRTLWCVICSSVIYECIFFQCYTRCLSCNNCFLQHNSIRR